jgi:hypothetical protein
VLIFYVDESGHHLLTRDRVDPTKLASGNSEFFVLAAVGIRDTSRRALNSDLLRIKREHFGPRVDELPWDATELKGRHLAVARRNLTVPGYKQHLPAGYEAFTTTQKIDDIEDDLRITFARYRPVIFTIAIDKLKVIPKDDQSALELAYGFLYRRVALILQRIYQGEGGVFVADQQAEHERMFDSGKLYSFRDAINQSGKRRADYELILDKPLWIDTKQSSWDREIIQLADIAAFHVNEVVRTSHVGSTELWLEIRRCMAVDARNGEPDGEGLMIFPMPKTWPTTTA